MYEATLNHIEHLHPTKEANAQEVHSRLLTQASKTTKKRPYCGGNHTGPRNKCPAFGSTCRNCALKNHWAAVCARRTSLIQQQTKQSQAQSTEQA